MRREIHWSWNGHDLPVVIDIADDRGMLSSPKYSTAFDVSERTQNSVRVSIDGKTYEAWFARDGRAITVWCNGSTYRLESHQGQTTTHAPADAHAAGEIRAPMAGKVTGIDVAVGDEVSEQQVVVILESMKMETSLSAIRSGRVKEVLVKLGDVVEMGAPLVIIE